MFFLIPWIYAPFLYTDASVNILLLLYLVGNAESALMPTLLTEAPGRSKVDGDDGLVPLEVDMPADANQNTSEEDIHTEHSMLDEEPIGLDNNKVLSLL